jgi:hypothetical protein
MTWGAFTLTEKDKIETKLDKALGFSLTQRAREYPESTLLPEIYRKRLKTSWKDKSLAPDVVSDNYLQR